MTEPESKIIDIFNQTSNTMKEVIRVYNDIVYSKKLIDGIPFGISFKQVPQIVVDHSRDHLYKDNLEYRAPIHFQFNELSCYYGNVVGASNIIGIDYKSINPTTSETLRVGLVEENIFILVNTPKFSSVIEHTEADLYKISNVLLYINEQSFIVKQQLDKNYNEYITKIKKEQKKVTQQYKDEFLNSLNIDYN